MRALAVTLTSLALLLALAAIGCAYAAIWLGDPGGELFATVWLTSLIALSVGGSAAIAWTWTP